MTEDVEGEEKVGNTEARATMEVALKYIEHHQHESSSIDVWIIKKWRDLALKNSLKVKKQKKVTDFFLKFVKYMHFFQQYILGVLNIHLAVHMCDFKSKNTHFFSRKFLHIGLSGQTLVPRWTVKRKSNVEVKNYNDLSSDHVPILLTLSNIIIRKEKKVYQLE